MENKIIKYEGDLIRHAGNAFSITDKLLSVNSRALNIMHLDDHVLSGVITNCILRKFPVATIKDIKYADEGLEYVINCWEKNEKLDLIIINMIHEGLNGIAFSKAIRAKEKKNEYKIPILFLTSINTKSVEEQAEKILFTKYLILTSGCEGLYLAINNFI